MRIQHEKVRRSNFLINSAMDCSKVEKRALYLGCQKFDSLFK